jgi:hypothetical protein
LFNFKSPGAGASEAEVPLLQSNDSAKLPGANARILHWEIVSSGKNYTLRIPNNLIRYTVIHCALEKGRKKSLSQLQDRCADILRDMGATDKMTISERTIREDISVLRKIFRAPIKFSNNLYFYDEAFVLPFAPLLPGEPLITIKPDSDKRMSSIVFQRGDANLKESRVFTLRDEWAQMVVEFKRLESAMKLDLEH